MAITKKIEYLDLVDGNDNVIGKESRDVIYSLGLKNYRVVNIFVINSLGEILLPKRDATRKIFPNCYDFSCGEHVVSGEIYEQAALRGLKEELNISNIDLISLGKLTPNDGVSSFMEIFKVICDKKIIPNEKDGVASLSFISLPKLKEKFSKNPEIFKQDIPKVIELLGEKL